MEPAGPWIWISRGLELVVDTGSVVVKVERLRWWWRWCYGTRRLERRKNSIPSPVNPRTDVVFSLPAVAQKLHPLPTHNTLVPYSPSANALFSRVCVYSRSLHPIYYIPQASP